MLDEFEKLARRRVRGRVSEEVTRVRRTLPEAVTYGLGGAAIFPSIQQVQRLIEYKGRPFKPRRIYQLGKYKIPTRIPAAAATGFLAAGVIPYIQDLIRAGKGQKALTVSQAKVTRGLAKASALISPRVFMKPQFRGRLRARVPESSKIHAAKKLRMTRSTAKMVKGIHSP